MYLIFQVSQHNRDEQLMVNLNCGVLVERKDILDLRVSKFSDITDKIIPLFQKHPIVGGKIFRFS